MAFASGLAVTGGDWQSRRHEVESLHWVLEDAYLPHFCYEIG